MIMTRDNTEMVLCRNCKHRRYYKNCAKSVTFLYCDPITGQGVWKYDDGCNLKNGDLQCKDFEPKPSWFKAIIQKLKGK